jgi:hypothetical protein
MNAYPRTTAIPYPRHLAPDGTDAGWHLALGEKAVADDRWPTRTIAAGGIPCSKHRDFLGNRLGQKPLGTLASHGC